MENIELCKNYGKKDTNYQIDKKGYEKFRRKIRVQ